MNRFTATVWEVIADDDTLLTELGAIMRQQYPLFLSPEQTIKANTYQLEQHMVVAMTRWSAWLPDTPINEIGAQFVMEVLQDVEWNRIAARVLADAEQTAAVMSQANAGNRSPNRV